MSKGKMKMTTCPECGFTVKSPWGENDVVDHVMLHARNHHPEMLKHDKADLKKNDKGRIDPLQMVGLKNEEVSYYGKI